MRKTLTAILCWAVSITVFADSGIYICGHFRRDRAKTVPALKSSGYTFGILFNVHVEENGDLTTDGETICKDGVYVFGKTSPYYVDDINALVMGNTSILRLEHCIGGWGNYAYKNITNLIKKEGTGVNSILYRNFKALKEAIPVVEAINNDIEHEYEADTQSQFHIMLYDLGFKTTIAPYMNKSYWDDFVAKVNAARPGAVERNYLQCYGGGASNNPKNWNIENLPIYGSRDIEASSYTAQQIIETMTAWKNDAGIVGGFYWNYNTTRNLSAEAAPINEVFGGGSISYHDRIVAMVYSTNDYRNPQIDFSMGTYTSSQIKEKGFDPNDLGGIKLEKGVSMILYTGENNTGDVYTIKENVPDISTIIGDSKINSWTITANKLDGLDGKEFIIKNKQSGFCLQPSKNSSTSILPIQQKTGDGSDFTIWTLEAVKDGLYKIINKGSGLAMQVRLSVVSPVTAVYEGAIFEQKAYTGEEHQHFIVTYDEAEEAYKIKPLNSLKYMGIPDGKETSVDIGIVQRNSESTKSTNWLLVPHSSNSIEPSNEANSINVYPREVTDKINIENDGELMLTRLKILNLDGDSVMTINNVSNQVDLSSLYAGVYFLLLETRNGILSFKIIKK